MNKKIIIIIMICLIIGSFFAGRFYTRYRQNKDTELINIGFQQTAIQITQTGNIPIINNNTIQWIPIQNLCGGT